jgi:hypothetical protein
MGPASDLRGSAELGAFQHYSAAVNTMNIHMFINAKGRRAAHEGTLRLRLRYSATRFIEEVVMATIPRHKLLSGLIGSFLVFGAVALTKAQAPPSVLCYAFLKGNAYQASDLYVSCREEKSRITRTGDVWDFAVAANGSALALRRQRGTKKGFDDFDHRPIDIPQFEIEVVSLKGDFQKHWSRLDGDVSLYPSCDTILAITREVQALPSGGHPKVSYTTGNVLTDEPLRLDPYLAFGCNSDRKTIVGYLDPDRHTLWAGLPPRRVIVQTATGSGTGAFGISPNGQYVAYATDELCMDKDGKNLECLRNPGAYPFKISVSDSAAVLYEGGTSETCSGWECTGVFYWRPGAKEPKVIEAEGWYAQWITPEVAAALSAWSSYTNARAGTRRKRG